MSVYAFRVHLCGLGSQQSVHVHLFPLPAWRGFRAVARMRRLSLDGPLEQNRRGAVFAYGGSERRLPEWQQFRRRQRRELVHFGNRHQGRHGVLFARAGDPLRLYVHWLVDVVIRRNARVRLERELHRRELLELCEAVDISGERYTLCAVAGERPAIHLNGEPQRWLPERREFRWRQWRELVHFGNRHQGWLGILFARAGDPLRLYVHWLVDVVVRRDARVRLERELHRGELLELR